MLISFHTGIRCPLLWERVSRDGVFISRRGTGEGSSPCNALLAQVHSPLVCLRFGAGIAGGQKGRPQPEIYLAIRSSRPEVVERSIFLCAWALNVYISDNLFKPWLQSPKAEDHSFKASATPKGKELMPFREAYRPISPSAFSTSSKADFDISQAKGSVESRA